MHCDDPEGLLLINKPRGKTSFYLVSFLRRLLKIKKIGHAGTLDPFATGVMVMLVGRSFTKLSDRLLNHDKEYVATIRLGVATDSYDCDGNVISESSKIPLFTDVVESLSHFQGNILQTPPMFSAKKINGKKLYELARIGKEVERAPVSVHLTTTLISYEYPFLKLKINCSKGTYVRSIGHDLGIRLGCGAHVSELVRTKSGPYRLEDCVDLNHLGQDLAIARNSLRQVL